ncbi:MAG: hypothetical protein KC933_00975 [Myxococcales bacterium]|nr:hypothetical protein [Myxococcales bacterium]MCB9647231.1 hypothetical protein [Deltaproteobacteria bacterium]
MRLVVLFELVQYALLGLLGLKLLWNLLIPHALVWTNDVDRGVSMMFELDLVLVAAAAGVGAVSSSVVLFGSVGQLLVVFVLVEVAVVLHAYAGTFISGGVVRWLRARRHSGR